MIGDDLYVIDEDEENDATVSKVVSIRESGAFAML